MNKVVFRANNFEELKNFLENKKLKGEFDSFFIFWKKGCSPCKELKERMKELTISIKYYLIDAGTEEGLKLAIKHSVSSLPTILFFKEEETELEKELRMKEKK